MKKEPKVVAARWFIGVVVACVVPVSNQSSQRQNHGCGRTNKGDSFDTSLIDP